MRQMLLALSLLFFGGCSSKQVYQSAMNFEKYRANVTTKEITIEDGLTLSYLENSIKSDKTLVLIHGFGANKENWLKLAQGFDEKYHLIIPDLIGDGESSKPLNISYDIESQTRRLHQFLSNFPNKKFILVGNSMGGQIALNYAYHYKIKGLVLIASMGLEVKESYIDRLGTQKIREMYTNVCSLEKMQTIMQLGFYNPPSVPNFILEYLMQKKCKLSELEIHKYREILDDKLNLFENMTEISKSTTIPTLILWGQEDKIIDIANAYAFHSYIKKSELIVIKNSGHMPMLETPQKVAKGIMTFLSSHNLH